MSALEVVFVSEGNCPNCNNVRAVLNKVHHKFRHVDVAEVNPAEPLGRSLSAEYVVRVLPALIVGGHLRLVGEISEREIYNETRRAKHHSQH